MEQGTIFDELTQIDKIFGTRLDRNYAEFSNFRVLNLFSQILFFGFLLNCMWLFGVRMGVINANYWYVIYNLVWFGILYFVYYFSQKFYNEPNFYKKILLQPKKYNIEFLYEILKITIYPIGYKDIFDQVIKEVYKKEELEKLATDDKTILDIYYWLINDSEVKNKIITLIKEKEKVKEKKES